MKIIDAHIHTSFQKKELRDAAKYCNIDFSLEGLASEMKRNNVAYVVSLTDTFADKTPIGYNWILKQIARCEHIIGICGINPLKAGSDSMAILRKLLEQKLIRGIKIYLGYYPKYPTDKCYFKFYKLAQEFDVPVIFHAGDTLVKNVLLKYAHPLIIDEIAVKYPNLKIIIAHCGNPWVIDAAAVAYKNKNIYLDISGLAYKIIGEDVASKLKYVQDYAGADKLIYGSDWPIVKMTPYLKFMKSIIAKKYHSKVFYKNAAMLFKIRL